MLRMVPLPRKSGGGSLRRHSRRLRSFFFPKLQLEQAAWHRLSTPGAEAGSDFPGGTEAKLPEHAAGGGIVDEVAGDKLSDAQAVARGV